MLWNMRGLAAYLLFAVVVIIMTHHGDVTAESDMMTLEEYRHFVTQQAQKNKKTFPKKVWTISEKSLYDDLGDVPVTNGKSVNNHEPVTNDGMVSNLGPVYIGDLPVNNSDGPVTEDESHRSKTLVELKRFHRDGKAFSKLRYRRSLDPNTTPDAEPQDLNPPNIGRHIGSEGRHIGSEDRKYLPQSGQVHVVSSAIRVLPNKDEGHRTARIMNVGGEEKKENGTVGEGKVEDDGHRQKRNEYQWRRPKTQFVTGTYRMTPPSSRFQLPAFPPQARNTRRYLLDNEVSPYRRSGSSSGSGSQRRIIYYATLPEIVRPPTTNNNQWQRHQSFTSGLTSHASTSPHLLPPTPLHPHASPLHQHSTRQATVNHDNRPPYHSNPPPSDNEIIHVQSAVIDVTNNRDQPSLPSQQPPPTAILSSSAITSIPPQKYTIYDMEPPYMRQPYYNNYYNLDNKLSGYDKQRYSYYYQQYQPIGGQQTYSGTGGPYQNRFYEDVRTPPYRLQTPYQNNLPPYQNSVLPYQNNPLPYQNSLPPYQNALPPYQNAIPPYQSPPLYYRKPEFVPVEVQTTAPTSVSSSSTTTTTQETPGVGDPRNQASSTSGTGVGGDLKQDKGNSTNNLVSRYV